jgi:hypothetical protein
VHDPRAAEVLAWIAALPSDSASPTLNNPRDDRRSHHAASPIE